MKSIVGTKLGAPSEGGDRQRQLRWKEDGIGRTLTPNSIDEIPPVRLAHHAFAAAIAAPGIEHVLACATECANVADRGALRMSDEEKTGGLQALRRQRYALEVEEEATRGKELRRTGVSSGVLLGLTADAAEQQGMI